MLRTGNYDDVEKAVDRVGYGEDFRVTFDALVGTIPVENPSSARTTVAEKRCHGDAKRALHAAF